MSLRRKRGSLRTVFTKAVTAIEEELQKENISKLSLNVLLGVLEERAEALLEVDKEILDALVEEDASEEDFQLEVDGQGTYRHSLLNCRALVEEAVSKIENKTEFGSAHSHEGTSSRCGSPKRTRKYKLPLIELKKFNGDVKCWLGFWSQFLKIHEDEELVAVDKFQYLRQATVDGSKAREVVDSFPLTAANYPKCIAHLKSRFGNEDTLVEVYVRELLRLVLNNALDQKKKIVMSSLYDKLSAQLRALESLGVTTEKYAAILYPLVESSLPHETLQAWERNKNILSSKNDENNNSVHPNRLDAIMYFLRCEVDGQERMSLSYSGFGFEDEKCNVKITEKSKKNSKDIPTAAGLFSSDLKSADSKCIFCEKQHFSAKCYSAAKMTLEDKKKIVYTKKCCFACLKQGHMAKDCRLSVKCSVCNKNHYSVLCPEKHKSSYGESGKSLINTDSTLSNQNSYNDVLLQTLLVKVRTEEKVCVFRALFDSGSQRSYITPKVAKTMNYKCIGHETTQHGLFGGEKSSPLKHNLYKIHLADLQENYGCTFQVMDQQKICGNIPRINRGEWIADLPCLGVVLTDVGEVNMEIDILIGADVCGKLFTDKKFELSSGVVVWETKLGWIAMGKLPVEDRSNYNTSVLTSLFVAESSVADLWRLDTIGIMDPAETQSKEELHKAAMDHFENTVALEKDGRYIVGLPWIEGHPPLGSNRKSAEVRLKSATNKLLNTNNYQRYDDVFQDWLKSEIIEEVPTSELENPAHYLPHRPVIKENSETTKVRPVFDASAKEKGFPSLNNCLEKGPNLLEMIPAIISRFRMKKYGIISDICKAFLQIKVKDGECDYLRFLWWEMDRKTVKVFRHKRVVFGVTSSPFLLGAVLLDIINKSPPQLKQTADLLKSSFYVDNCVCSVDSEQELKRFIVESQQLLIPAKFDLRGWEHTGNCDVSSQKNKIIPVLGMLWNLTEDSLSCDMRNFSFDVNENVTKRKVLSFAHRVYDTIGFACPILLCPKLLLQETWKLKLGWDDVLPEELSNRFRCWIKQLPMLSEINVPRWMVGENCDSSNLTLHVCTDASEVAYAAVVFLRTETESGVNVQLVQAKARVAPVKIDKKVTIPRKELLSCCIGARLAATVRKDLSLENIPVHYWNDSMNALWWIRKEEAWGTFVWNRVKEIRELSAGCVWNHVPGVFNPADLPSRGCTVRQLLDSKWWEGPAWMKLPPEKWPNAEIVCDEDVVNAERKKIVVSCLATGGKTVDTTWMSSFSNSYKKILRLICWMKRFIFNVRNPVEKRILKKTLTVKEMEDAEKTVVKLVQLEAFREKPVFRNMQTFRDKNGIVRIKTQVLHRKDSEGFRMPAILPSQHQLVKIIVQSKHVELCHAGLQTVMCVLREKYWILQSRRAIRKVLYNCVKCKRFRGLPIVPVPASPPEERVRDAAVFEVTGVDLTGPLFLKGGQKSWIVLYTCAVYRAVHLELVTSLSTDAFLQSLRRFVSRRGRPKLIYSDNATNFAGTANAFAKLNWEKIASTTTAQKIIWKFIPPNAAWWGGWWERLIGILKTLLRNVLGKATLEYEELVTILCDCEDVVNSRPLTYLSEDYDDLSPLTPKMFLYDLEESGVPDLDAVETGGLHRRWTYRQRLHQDLRSRFRKEYLGQLASQQRKQPFGELAVGDVVFVRSDNTKRMDWPLGRILELVPGKDGKARVARVKTTTGEIMRPVQRLYPLEMTEEEKKSQQVETGGIILRSGRKLIPSTKLALFNVLCM